MKPVLIISSDKTVFHHTVATVLSQVSCLVPESSIDSMMVNSVNTWFQDKFKPFAESYIEAVATVDQANIMLRDLAVARAYYQSKKNQRTLLSSISKAYNHKVNYITKVIEAVQGGIKAYLKSLGNSNPDYKLVQTRVSAQINKIEPYTWNSDETVVSHAWYHNGTVATVPGETTQPVNPNPQQPMQPKKGWFDRNYKKIMFGTLVLSLIKK
tara:strand:+ start:11647 stop:12282 length:636 start_codon:yes stop_codon:yes gene_type:complete